MVAGRSISMIGLTAVLLLSAPLVAFAQGEEEEKVRTYFADIPVMVNIAECESKFTQFGKGGTALQGGMNGKMIGIFQFYGDIHAAYAAGLGMDISTTDGNLAYARHLYEREGTTPWLSSFPCWSAKSTTPELAAASAPATASTNAILTANLSLGQEHPQVLTLQKILNGNGFVLTTEGPGSPGNETTKYGSLTRDAVRRFQCAKSIVCEGDEYSSGYGFVGARTRTALLALDVSPVAVPVTTPASAPASTSSSASSNDAEISRLQAQIVELTKLLAELLAKRS